MRIRMRRHVVMWLGVASVAAGLLGASLTTGAAVARAQADSGTAHARMDQLMADPQAMAQACAGQMANTMSGMMNGNGAGGMQDMPTPSATPEATP